MMIMKIIVALFMSLVALASESGEPTYNTRKIHVAGRAVTAEIADTPDRRSHGLMFRQKLPDDHGMLFVFEGEEPLGFWMKNTLIPLSIGFFDKDKRLIDTQEMVPASAVEVNPKVYNSSAPAMYALEMPKGWFAHHQIKKGAKLIFDK